MENYPVVPFSEFTENKLRTSLLSGKEALKQHYDFNNEDVDHEEIFFI